MMVVVQKTAEINGLLPWATCRRRRPIYIVPLPSTRSQNSSVVGTTRPPEATSLTLFLFEIVFGYNWRRRKHSIDDRVLPLSVRKIP